MSGNSNHLDAAVKQQHVGVWVKYNTNYQQPLDIIMNEIGEGGMGGHRTAETTETNLMQSGLYILCAELKADLEVIQAQKIEEKAAVEAVAEAAAKAAAEAAATAGKSEEGPSKSILLSSGRGVKIAAAPDSKKDEDKVTVVPRGKKP